MVFLTSSLSYRMMLLYVIGFPTAVLTLNTGVGRLPVMGYDTWNAFGCEYDGALALEQGRLMQEYGLVDIGYKTVCSY